MEKSDKQRLINESEIPMRITRKTDVWLQRFLNIPKGKALALPEDELTIKPVTLVYLVGLFKRKGRLPENYKAIQRKLGGKTTVYVVNSAEGTEKKTVPVKPY